MASSVIAGGKAKKYGKIGVAKANTVRIVSEGLYEVERQKFLSTATSLGITFDTNNAVNGNITNDRLDSLELEDANLDSRLDTLESSYIVTTNELVVINNKINAIANVLGITFNVDGTLNTEAYTTHTHIYSDDNGTIITDKSTQGVS